MSARVAAMNTEPVSVKITDNGAGPEIAPRYLGLSYEMSMVSTQSNGRYYFDPKDQALINLFHTLGIKSLRVGANAVDDPRISVPGEKDMDVLFSFARAAGVKVIYSFRLKDGSPENSARLAAFIAAHYADVLDCYAIGNEPNFYLKTFPEYFAVWKPHYDAILNAVPGAMFDGPGTSGGHNPFPLQLAKALASDHHIAMISDHYYFLGSGRAAENEPAVSRARFLSNHLHADYEKAWNQLGAALAAEEVPYRIDELNSCYNGGAKDSSDTYASSLWALDCTHWWAAHGILGMNYHTGDSVGRDGHFGPCNYAGFVHAADGRTFIVRPQGYAYLAFTQAARGRPLQVSADAKTSIDFNGYAYRDRSGEFYVTLINKSYGPNACVASVALVLPPGSRSGKWQRMDLLQKDGDAAAKTGVLLGGASIDPEGNWAGKWQDISGGSRGDLEVKIAPASAALLRFSPQNG